MSDHSISRDSECPSHELLDRLVHGTTSGKQEATLAEHISTCELCQAHLDTLANQDNLNLDASSLDVSDDDDHLKGLIDKLSAEPQFEDSFDVSTLLTPSADPSYIGMFDHYEVLEVVGRGGMGIVLKARDPSLDRIVAIKTILPQMAISVRARERFLREAKNTAAVNHPNIVTIYSVDLRNGVPYLVMEFIPGRSLESELASGPVPEGEMLRISHQMAQALSAAHAQGLIHRDIKPANILLENGVPKVSVTDFGLSRAIDDVSMTRPGTVAGTPQFMSPEQAEGKTTDSKSDLFSLGAVMYAMCTGQPAFQGESSLAVIRQVCDATPEPIRV